MSDLGISNTPDPDVDKPDDGSTVDWEHQYNELRPEYTRTTQSLSEARERLSDYEAFMEALSDPGTQAEALAQLGVQVDTGPQGGEDVDDDFADPLANEVQELRQMVSEMASAWEQETSAKEQDQLDDMRDAFIGDAVGVIEGGLKKQFGQDFKFSTSEEEVLGNLAIAMADEEGVPDVQGAFESLYGETGVLETNRQRWIDSKTTAAIPPAGRTIPSDERPASRRERVAYFDDRVAALEQANQ